MAHFYWQPPWQSQLVGSPDLVVGPLAGANFSVLGSAIAAGQTLPFSASYPASIRLQPGITPFSGLLTVPPNITIRGSGKGLSTLQLTAAGTSSPTPPASGSAYQNTVKGQTQYVIFSGGTPTGFSTTGLVWLGLNASSGYPTGSPVPNAPAWSSATAYVAGQIVQLAGNYYVCTNANTNEQPPNASYWAVYSQVVFVLGYEDTVTPVYTGTLSMTVATSAIQFSSKPSQAAFYDLTIDFNGYAWWAGVDTLGNPNGAGSSGKTTAAAFAEGPTALMIQNCNAINDSAVLGYVWFLDGSAGANIFGVGGSLSCCIANGATRCYFMNDTVSGAPGLFAGQVVEFHGLCVFSPGITLVGTTTFNISGTGPGTVNPAGMVVQLDAVYINSVAFTPNIINLNSSVNTYLAIGPGCYLQMHANNLATTGYIQGNESTTYVDVFGQPSWDGKRSASSGQPLSTGTLAAVWFHSGQQLDLGTDQTWAQLISTITYLKLTIAAVSTALQTSVTGNAKLLASLVPPSIAGLYRISLAVDVGSATSGVVAFYLSYTDGNGNSVTSIEPSLFQLGTAAPAKTFTTSAASNYYTTVIISVNASGGTINIRWEGSGTIAALASVVVVRLTP